MSSPVLPSPLNNAFSYTVWSYPAIFNYVTFCLRGGGATVGYLCCLLPCNSLGSNENTGCVFVDELVHIHTHKVCFLSLIYFCVWKLYVKCNCSQLKGTLYSLGLCGWYNRTYKKTRTTLSNFISRRTSTLIFVFWIHFNKAISEMLDSEHIVQYV